MREQLSDREKEVVAMREKMGELQNMVRHLCSAQKSLNNTGLSSILDNNNINQIEKAKDGLERMERIAKTTNKSSFMNLGENKHKLISEE